MRKHSLAWRRRRLRTTARLSTRLETVTPKRVRPPSRGSRTFNRKKVPDTRRPSPNTAWYSAETCRRASGGKLWEEVIGAAARQRGRAGTATPTSGEASDAEAGAGPWPAPGQGAWGRRRAP